MQLNHGPIADAELDHRLSRYGLNPCGEILGADFHCNLAEIHLNQIDPSDEEGQADAFRAAALSVACLLNHRFEVERYRQSRAWDPIVGVSFTGLFDFFVHAFGTPWLQWWEAGRPDSEEGRALQGSGGRLPEPLEAGGERHRLGLLRSPRPAPTQPLHHRATGRYQEFAHRSCSWLASPKAQRFIRRITFRKNDPVAMACMDYGYTSFLLSRTRTTRDACSTIPLIPVAPNGWWRSPPK